MEHDPDQNVAAAAISTAEHRSLGNVLEVIRRLEELRSRGLSAAQIAERIRLTHPNRPGGGPWSPAAVERVLEIADANRAQPVDPPVTRQVPATPPVEAPVFEATPFDATPDPNATVHQAAPAYPPPQTRLTSDQQRAPLRVEPRRYHQRPSIDAAPATSDQGRRWPAVVGVLTLTALVAVGIGLYQLGTLDQVISSVGSTSSSTSNETEPDSAEAAAAVDAVESDDTADGAGVSDAADAAAAAVDAADNPADSLTIRIEPSAPETDGSVGPATATIRTDGKLYIEGAFRSETEARSFLDSAAEVFGQEALVPEYTIDPAAPDPTVSDVVLEKPVLFESGSSVIDPEYIPFLEACGDVLKLNPHIVMSVTAFTDSSGNAEFNLELSQQRAEAVIDFYRTLDIGDDQLISTGFGASDFVAGNDTEEGRQQNRRAMLELLNVMQDG